MAQIDLYLKRVVEKCPWGYDDDLYSLYDFATEEMRCLFAIYHTQLNKWFAVLNSDLRTKVDDNGNRVYDGGYFHAQDSRDLLEVFNAVEVLKTKCSGTGYRFSISEGYDELIKNCKRFIEKSGGSIIPTDFQPIDIVDLSPIFQFANSETIERADNVLYVDLKMIGEGSYATVFSYDDPSYGIPIALKRAKADLNEKELNRFEQEFAVLKSLKSAYVVNVYAYNEQKNEYTMERMDENLFNFIRKRNDRLTLQERKRIIAQICRGMSYIHKNGLLHRDISATNVFVKHFDDVDVFKIGDFGLVKLPDSNLTSFQTEFKGALNDPSLINVGFAEYEMRHETYALTRLFYFVLTGRTNYEKQKAGAIKRFWEKGTSPDLQERYLSVEEMQDRIAEITEENK